MTFEGLENAMSEVTSHKDIFSDSSYKWIIYALGKQMPKKALKKEYSSDYRIPSVEYHICPCCKHEVSLSETTCKTCGQSLEPQKDFEKLLDETKRLANIITHGEDESFKSSMDITLGNIESTLAAFGKIDRKFLIYFPDKEDKNE